MIWNHLKEDINICNSSIIRTLIVLATERIITQNASRCSLNETAPAAGVPGEISAVCCHRFQTVYKTECGVEYKESVTTKWIMLFL
jgi:hypothetical protein